ncbi:FliM/FliN family flagellar motor switch protein [Roseibium aggregatum]|uniref:Flagellar motor switch protein FliN n=1 Tax=Roseibium aggregatum TaxID=187304 RepID=A0A939EE75_9HYPH|nr:FliM/FliN family flagellar motor switch protein [Roseibium aggregatum]MBN9670912.1 flagellar motor switch protein FliN [Roseibium aggregatum]
MATFDEINVDISVVLGESEMPVHQLLRMGRGAVIDLDVSEDDDVKIYANNTLVAKGQVVLLGERIGISITEVLMRAPDQRPMRSDGPL